MISPRILWILLMTFSTWKGVMTLDREACVPIRLSPNQQDTLPDVETLRIQRGLPGKAGGIGPVGPQGAQGPRGLPGTCACDPSEIAQIHVFLGNITAKLESLIALHHYALKVDQCDHMPCKNGGTCINDGNSYICNCTDGYEGHDCSIRIQCVVPSSPNNGTISRESGQLVPYKENITYRCNDRHVVAYQVNNFLVTTCQETKQWTKDAPVCVVDDCNPDSCSGRGTCINQIGRTICECDEGYEGSDCSVQSNPCDLFPCGERGVCIWNGGTSYTCRCLVEFRGNDCETYDANLCVHTVGMEDGRVENGDITASRSSNYPSYRARLHNSYGWEIYSANIYDWLQVDLKKNTTVVAVASQGSASGSYYVRSYKIAYGFAPNALQIIKDSNGEDMIFQGNSNHNTVVRNNFPSPVTARYFRILLQSWNGNYGGLRLEYYSCYP
ncbi:EGF-like repeat and discoidin I-like domain-containing protein 3 isoform X1 [Clavelina lepadiformis]|uniref:EGF-like repeat and discoidin I-like domain-containing protein 3 isoform X1 n=1 Tax=Clavelina lepadiformis TaxID=159417 RepID=UPI004042F3B3